MLKYWKTESEKQKLVAGLRNVGFFSVSAFLPSAFISEVSFLLAVFHGGFRALVVGAGAALGLAGGGDLRDDLVEVGSLGFHGAGAGRVTDGTEADDTLGHLLVLLCLEEFGHGQQRAVALEDLALVGEVD